MNRNIPDTVSAPVTPLGMEVGRGRHKKLPETADISVKPIVFGSYTPIVLLQIPFECDLSTPSSGSGKGVNM